MLRGQNAERNRHRYVAPPPLSSRDTGLVLLTPRAGSDAARPVSWWPSSGCWNGCKHPSFAAVWKMYFEPSPSHHFWVHDSILSLHLCVSHFSSCHNSISTRRSTALDSFQSRLLHPCPKICDAGDVAIVSFLKKEGRNVW